MNTKISGSCLCGDIRYSVDDLFHQLYFCHCDQCKKITGSAYASNLFIKKEYLNWVEGEERITIYKDPKRDFTKVFCPKCGSGLPFISGDGKQYIVPAGTLSEEPTKPNTASIFCGEISQWEKSISTANKFKRFPE